MARPAVPNKRFSMNGLIEEWTDEHHIVYRPFSLQDVESIKNVDVNRLEAVNGFMGMLKQHFVSGKWLVSDDDGSNVRTEDMVAEDVLALPVEVTNAWLSQAMGQVSPKPAAN